MWPQAVNLWSGSVPQAASDYSKRSVHFPLHPPRGGASVSTRPPSFRRADADSLPSHRALHLFGPIHSEQAMLGTRMLHV